MERRPSLRRDWMRGWQGDLAVSVCVGALFVAAGLWFDKSVLFGAAGGGVLGNFLRVALQKAGLIRPRTPTDDALGVYQQPSMRDYWSPRP